MILRRFSEALKQQNWAAIAIEFVLLVAGVFLGIQVANWNESGGNTRRKPSTSRGCNAISAPSRRA